MNTIKSSQLLYGVLLVALPVVSYVFLDQLSRRRADDYAHKWLARETPNLHALERVIPTYEEVLLGSTDIKGLGLINDGRVTMALGERPAQTPTLSLSEGQVQSEANGFLSYQTTLRLSPHKAVYFMYADDSALLDYFWLLGAMGLFVLFTLLMRIKVDRDRRRLIEENAILAIQGFAHDFRGPFSKLQLLTTQMKEAPEPATREFEIALKQADGLLTDFLGFGREVTTQPTDLAPLLKAQSAYVDKRAKERGLTLSFNSPSSLFAEANAVKTERILSNLIDNAIKHAKSQVEVSTRAGKETLEIAVTNDGPGISKNDLPHIFEAFYSQRKGGIGLGLFISRAFARAQGGDIRCTTQENETTFTLSLKAAKEPVIEQYVTRSRTRDRGLIRMAFVDDEAFYRQLVRDRLTQADIAVELYERTDDLLLALKNGQLSVDLILVDRFGPDFDSIKDRFAESCRDFGFKGPIVLYSNAAASDQRLPEIFKTIDKSHLLSRDDIHQLIEEFSHESQ